MCGIAGILSLNGVPPPRMDELRAMARALHHRGPDGQGARVFGAVGLAHARLSIIDLAGGTQPMGNETEDVWVTFNGEIFNHVELRRSLQKQGHVFRTLSDTEVIVHLYEQYGEQFVEHLNGQFALGLWDTRRQRLVLARDRVGIRPLLYAQVGGRLVFASEAKSLFALPEIPRRIDPLALVQVFSLWGPIDGATAFEGIRSLPPGHTLCIDSRGIDLRRYWDWSFDPDAIIERRLGECADELKSLLIDAVRLQLQADVPVGTYLSGGLDSSVITALVRNHTSSPLRSFSLTFDDPEFDESKYQQQLSTRLGAIHSSVRVSRRDIALNFPRTIWHTEVPIVRTAPTPLMLLSGHVRSAGYKVVLSGEGADEVLAGYDLFKEARVRRFMARQPASSWRPRLLERLYPYLKQSPVAHSGLARQFFANGAERLGQPCFSHQPRIDTTQRALRFLRPELQQVVDRWNASDALNRLMPSQSPRWSDLGRDQYLEAHTLLSSYLLSAQGDRVAMANSVEGRVPFLDHRVIEFANRLPPSYKLRGLLEKFVLKEAVRGEIPDSIRMRTKQPYRAPDSAAFFEDGRAPDYVNELFEPRRLAEAGLFDPMAASRLFQKAKAGRVIGFSDNMAFVGMLSAMLLHEQYVRPAKFDPQEFAQGATH